MPDYAYIHKELLKSGVSKKLLWIEYMEDCRQAGEKPLMYSQFCYYIPQGENKCCATMHISCKPAEQGGKPEECAGGGEESETETV